MVVEEGSILEDLVTEKRSFEVCGRRNERMLWYKGKKKEKEGERCVGRDLYDTFSIRKKNKERGYKPK